MQAPRTANRGFIVILVVSAILILSASVTLVFFTKTTEEYKSAAYIASQTKAKYLTQSGIEAAVMLLTRVPVNYLYEFGIMFSPPPLPFKEGMVSFTISEETGKINLNRLIHTFDDAPDLRTREMLDRLSESLGISYRIWDAVVDWIDENSVTMPDGFEEAEYKNLVPPRPVKNSRMDSISELLMIPGFDRALIYEDLRTERQKQEFSEDFLTEEEKLAVTEDDFKLINNITALLPARLEYGDKININSAPYHVILSLSESMTPEVARKILVERLQNGGRFEKLEDVQKALTGLPSLSGTSLYDEIKPRISVEDILYKIEAEGVTAGGSMKITAVFDKRARKLTMYTE